MQQQSYAIISHSQANNHASIMQRANTIPEYQTNTPQNLVLNNDNFENQKMASFRTANAVKYRNTSVYLSAS